MRDVEKEEDGVWEGKPLREQLSAQAWRINRGRKVCTSLPNFLYSSFACDVFYMYAAVLLWFRYTGTDFVTFLSFAQASMATPRPDSSLVQRSWLAHCRFFTEFFVILVCKYLSV